MRALCMHIMFLVNGGVSNFASSLIKGYGFSGLNATLLQLPTGAFEFFLLPIAGLVATYVKNTRCWVLAGICVPPFAALLGIRFTGLDKKWTLVGELMNILIGHFSFLLPDFQSSPRARNKA